MCMSKFLQTLYALGKLETINVWYFIDVQDSFIDSRGYIKYFHLLATLIVYSIKNVS